MTSINAIEARLVQVSDRMKKIESLKKKYGKMNVQGLDQECISLLDACSDHTMEFGHSERSDSVKDKAFEILGKCLGEDL